MKRRLKLLKALENGTLTDEEKIHIKQFPHLYNKPKPKVIKKVQKKVRKK